MTQHQMETRAELYAQFVWMGAIVLIAIVVATITAWLGIWAIVSGLISGGIVLALCLTGWYDRIVDEAEEFFLKRLKSRDGRN
jgi:hypothetical protein